MSILDTKVVRDKPISYGFGSYFEIWLIFDWYWYLRDVWLIFGGYLIGVWLIFDWYLIDIWMTKMMIFMKFSMIEKWLVMMSDGVIWHCFGVRNTPGWFWDDRRLILGLLKIDEFSTENVSILTQRCFASSRFLTDFDETCVKRKLMYVSKMLPWGFVLSCLLLELWVVKGSIGRHLR